MLEHHQARLRHRHHLDGTGNAIVSAGAGNDKITLGGISNSVVFNGSYGSVSGGQGNDSVTLHGAGKKLETLSFAGSNSRAAIDGTAAVSIMDLGSALRIDVGSNTQTNTIAGLGTKDTTGVVNLTNGVGGYNSVSDIRSPSGCRCASVGIQKSAPPVPAARRASLTHDAFQAPPDLPGAVHIRSAQTLCGHVEPVRLDGRRGAEFGLEHRSTAQGHHVRMVDPRRFMLSFDLRSSIVKAGMLLAVGC